MAYNIKKNPNMLLASMLEKMEGEPNKFTDKYGCTWVQETATGYRRLSDRFFIPSMSLYNHTNHSESARQIIINRIEAERLEAQKTGKTKTTVYSFSF